MSGAILCPGCGEMTSDGCEAVDENGNGLGYDNHTPCRCEEEQEYTMSNDTFRDWLADEITALRNSHVHYRGKLTYVAAMKVDGGLKEADRILARYDAEKAAVATDDAEPSNHADTTEAPRTGDPGDQAAWEREDYAYRIRIANVVRQYSGNLIDINDAVDAIAALPNDQAAYDAAMAEYQEQVARIVATALVFDPENRDVLGNDIRERSNTVARHLAALPKPVKGGEG